MATRILMACALLCAISQMPGRTKAGLPKPKPEAVARPAAELRLLNNPVRDARTDAQLMFWESSREYQYARSGSKYAQCEYVVGTPLHACGRWAYDDDMTRCNFDIQWEHGVGSASNIYMVISRVLEQRFLRSVDTFYFLHRALERGSAVTRLRVAESQAVFYCYARRIASDRLLFVVSVDPLSDPYRAFYE